MTLQDLMTRETRLSVAAVNKTTRIVFLILAAFVLSSLAIYRLRVNGAKPARQHESAHAIRAVTKTVEGQIGAVDPDARTFILDDGTGKVILAFDERTEIVEAGRIVEPTSITSGVSATIKYTQRHGRNLARKIELIASAAPD
ncbi:MAG: hypothetical protein WAU45_11050 [Blastocatellia bacterium]